MASKGAKEIIANKLGFKNGGLKSVETELEKVKKENAQLKKTLDELSKRNGQHPLTHSGSDNASLQEVSACEIAVVQEQLRDALEKNQHWLVYDQQREAYVQGILSRMAELEQQLNNVKPHVSLHCGPDQSLPSAEHDQVLHTVQRELEEKRKRVDLLQAELEELRVQCEDRKQEVAKKLLEKQTSGQLLVAETAGDVQNKLELANARLEEEKKRAADLQLQVNLLQNSLLKHHEEQQRIMVLEQQLQMSAKDFENEKLDQQSLQHQLRKVLKELRKARDQITRLESIKPQKDSCFSKSSSYNRQDSWNCALSDLSPTKTYNALDESYLECPNCRTSYPTSHHRELLMHLDYCFK
ncbi:centrosomal protein of 55 kDa [Salminus brasiliensis]|uniref:centrosomal protein of 55 kDa n=1 Tax=Salminus brasiliensis TaxID=930266 RepID=UPI003B831854